jgi:N6-adenosine-specific RNA methylase IME4
MLTKPQPTLAIDRVVVGKRHRRDLGDLDGLAASMAELGLLQPIVVRPDGRLIAGERRLRAAEQLGWRAIPVHVVDLAAVVRGEFAENAIRKDFTLSEAVAIKRAVEPEIKAAAKARMVSGRPGANLAQGPKGKARDLVASFTGKKRSTLDKAAAVVDAAEAEPERFGKLLADMDKSGRVNGPFKRLKVARQSEAIRAEPSPLPNRGPYRVAVCDVPWPSEPNDPEPAERGYWPFPTMSIEQLCALDVGSIMHADAVMWFWTTNFHMRYAFTILDAWGFYVPTILTWAKDRDSLFRAHWLHGQTEHALMAVRGKPIVTLSNQTTLLRAPVRKPLGTKPPEFYDLVEKLCPAPRYADVFSRYRHNEKWDCHGDEAPREEPPAPEPAPPTEKPTQNNERVSLAEPAPQQAEPHPLDIPPDLRRSPAR